jgi:hypothetical protein
VLALKVLVRSARLGGGRLGVLDQLLRPGQQLGQKVLATDSEPIHELIELLVPSKRQISLEDQAVHAVQSGYNGIRELRPKPRGDTHGVLLPEGR